MASSIENKCLKKGLRLTDQRKLVAKIMSDSEDHPDVDELHKRVSKYDSKIRSINTFIVLKKIKKLIRKKILKKDVNSPYYIMHPVLRYLTIKKSKI